VLKAPRLHLPIIQCLSQLLVGDPGILHRIRRIGVPELPLHGGNVAGLIDKVPAHGVPGVMGGVAS